ncbi:hypothetical protein WA158_004254 [Blastocystis sp. Blastoise]
MRSFYVLMALTFFIAACCAAKPKTAADCQVCVDVVSEIEKTITDEDRKDLTKIESKIDRYCNKKNLSQEQKKVCYHIDPIKREISRPISFQMPVEDICIRKLNKKNPEFCAIKYVPEGEKTATATVNYDKMKISQLKAILAEHKTKCVGCYEKKDYVKKVKEIMANESEL